MDPKALVVHLEKAHAEDFVLFRCSICERKFGTLRGIAIHYGKCLGKEPTPPAVENGTNGDNLKHSCTECPAKFKTKIGVGQHIRLRHPNVANERRIQAVKLDIERKKRARETARENKTRTTTLAAEAAPIASVTGEVTAVRKRTMFTAAEDEIIIKLNAQYAGNKKIKINVMIAESVPGKTYKQIGSRRKCLGLINSASNTLTPAPERSTVGCDSQHRTLQKPT